MQHKIFWHPVRKYAWVGLGGHRSETLQRSTYIWCPRVCSRLFSSPQELKECVTIRAIVMSNRRQYERAGGFLSAVRMLRSRKKGAFTRCQILALSRAERDSSLAPDVQQFGQFGQCKRTLQPTFGDNPGMGAAKYGPVSLSPLTTLAQKDHYYALNVFFD